MNKLEIYSSYVSAEKKDLLDSQGNTLLSIDSIGSIKTFSCNDSSYSVELPQISDFQTLFKKKFEVAFPLTKNKTDSVASNCIINMSLKPFFSIKIFDKEDVICEGVECSIISSSRKRQITFSIKTEEAEFNFQKRKLFDSERSHKVWKRANNINSIWKGFISSGSLSIERLGELFFENDYDIRLLIAVYIIDYYFSPSEANWEGWNN